MKIVVAMKIIVGLFLCPVSIYPATRYKCDQAQLNSISGWPLSRVFGTVCRLSVVWRCHLLRMCCG